MQQARYTLSDWLQILVEADNQMEASIGLLSFGNLYPHFYIPQL